MKKKIIIILIVCSLLFNVLHIVTYIERKEDLIMGLHNNLSNLSVILDSVIRDIETPYEEQWNSIKNLTHNSVQMGDILEELNEGMSSFKVYNKGRFYMFQEQIEAAILEKDVEKLEEYRDIIRQLREALSNKEGEVRRSVSIGYVLNKFEEAEMELE